jgi:ATP-dependent 26S proteasome regulatory subunit
LINSNQSSQESKRKKKDAASVAGAKLKKPVMIMKKTNKLWTKNDQIAVICCTNKPYEANLKDLKKLFDKKYYFPYPNYATRKLIFQSMVEQKLGKLPQGFAFNTIAHITEGFTGGSVIFFVI